MGELIWHPSPSNSNHLAARLVIVPEVVLLRLALDHLQEETAKLFVVGTLAHWRFDIELQMAAQTRPKLPSQVSLSLLQLSQKCRFVIAPMNPIRWRES